MWNILDGKVTVIVLLGVINYAIIGYISILLSHTEWSDDRNLISDREIELFIILIRL